MGRGGHGVEAARIELKASQGRLCSEQWGSAPYHHSLRVRVCWRALGYGPQGHTKRFYAYQLGGLHQRGAELGGYDAGCLRGVAWGGGAWGGVGSAKYTPYGRGHTARDSTTRRRHRAPRDQVPMLAVLAKEAGGRKPCCPWNSPRN